MLEAIGSQVKMVRVADLPQALITEVKATSTIIISIRRVRMFKTSHMTVTVPRLAVQPLHMSYGMTMARRCNSKTLFRKPAHQRSRSLGQLLNRYQLVSR